MSKNISHSDPPPFPKSNNETYQRKNKNVSSQFKMNKKPGCFQNKVSNFNLREFIKTFQVSISQTGNIFVISRQPIIQYNRGRRSLPHFTKSNIKKRF